jgi:hypothetical protein
VAHLNLEEAKAEKEKRSSALRRQMKNSYRTKMTFRLLPADLKKFKKKLLEDGKTANDFLNDMILKYIEKE